MKKYVLFIFMLLLAPFSWGQRFSFVTDQPTEYQFTADHSRQGKPQLVTEGKYLFLDINVEKRTITRIFANHLTVKHHIDWTQETRPGDKVKIQKYKTDDGWRFYITFVNGVAQYCRVIDLHNKQILYQKYNS